MYESVSQGDSETLFHTKGPTVENAQSPSLVYVCTVMAALVVADWRWLQTGINADEMY